MRLLLDEGLPWAFRKLFTTHDAVTVDYMGWKSKSNGELLELARNDFDALITPDRAIPYQQHVTEADVAVIILITSSTDIESLNPLLPAIEETLDTIRRGDIIYVEAQ